MIIETGSPIRDLAYNAPPTGLKWPKATATEIAKYEKAWDEYDAALLKLQEAEGVLESASAEDTRALIEAVAIESPDPGTPNQDKARRALEYAGERLRQKYTAATHAEGAMIKQVRAEHGDVVQQAARRERQLIDRLTEAHTEAVALVAKANTAFSEFGVTVNQLEWLGLETIPGIKYGHPLAASGIVPPTLNPSDYNAAQLRLDRIEGTTAPIEPGVVQPAGHLITFG